MAKPLLQDEAPATPAALTAEYVAAIREDNARHLEDSRHGCRSCVLMVARLLDAHDALRARLAEVERERDEARWRPLGDNHHNAIACPYCNPDRIDPAALTADPRASLAGQADAARGRMAMSVVTEAEVREWLWLAHGHVGLYGDDGERQCNHGPLLADFTRDPFNRLARHCVLALLDARDRLAATIERMQRGADGLRDALETEQAARLAAEARLAEVEAQRHEAAIRAANLDMDNDRLMDLAYVIRPRYDGDPEARRLRDVAADYQQRAEAAERARDEAVRRADTNAMSVQAALTARLEAEARAEALAGALGELTAACDRLPASDGRVIGLLPILERGRALLAPPPAAEPE